MGSENKSLERQQFKILTGVQNRSEVQSKTVKALCKQLEQNRQGRKEIWLTRREELFSRLDEMSNNIKLLSSQFGSYRPSQMEFAERVQLRADQILRNQEKLKEGLCGLNGVVCSKTQSLSKVVKRLDGKIQNLQTEKILDTLEQIKDML